MCMTKRTAPAEQGEATTNITPKASITRLGCPSVLISFCWNRDLQFSTLGAALGQFANFLFDQGFCNYQGLDFSGEAIRIAKESNPEHAQKFFQGDAFQSDLFAGQYDLVIMFEILEHINQDLELIGLVRPGTKMIVSVPNFPDPYHVRYFQNMDEVVDGQVMNIFDTKTFALNANHKLFYVVGEKK